TARDPRRTSDPSRVTESLGPYHRAVSTPSVRLAPDQVKALRRVASSPRTPPAVARRARIVLAASGHPAGNDAPVSRTTADRWVRRFTAAGVAGLADLPRSGRPPAVADAAAHPLIVAPLLAPTVGWTSRHIAELT